MCGIAGFVTKDKKIATREVLGKMLTQIEHRGPDSSGTYLEDGVGLGIRRLAIIDLKTGDQPIHNEDKTVWVVLNGEIYNFRELRTDLVKKGHQFYTQTDTEVIAHLYEDHSKNFVKHLDGMFALALWDKKRQTLFCARDRFGKKPFHYIETGGEFVFASEIKSLLVYPGVKKELEGSSLEKYFLYGFVPAPRSIYKGIRKLLPAHTLIYRGGKIETEPYWEVEYRRERGGSEEECLAKLENLLSRAVERRLVSDVPLGVFLSGGVDSSLVVALMAKLVGGESIKSFSIGFDKKSFDETPYALKVAGKFKTDHRYKVFDAKNCYRALLEIPNFLDEPISDPSIVPTYLLSKFTRDYVMVALSGDGGDEIFGGYPKYFVHRLTHFVRGVPRFLSWPLERILEAVPTSSDNKVFNYKIKRFISGMKYPPAVRNQVWIAPFSPREVLTLLGRKNFLSEDPFEEISTHLKSYRSAGKDIFNQMNFLDIKLTLQDHYLVKVDRASMANSLEVRSPFLDTALVEFSFSIPSHLKVKGFQTKYLLKKLAEKYLPRETVYRYKMGFGIPINYWLRQGDLKELVFQYLGRGALGEQTLLDTTVVAEILKSHYQEGEDRSNKIWALLMLRLWEEKWLKS